MNKARLTELLANLAAQPGEIEVVAKKENEARLARDEAKESYELAVTNALISANGKCDGKNAEERKLKSDAYLAKHPEVKAAKARLNAAEADYLDAQLDTRHEEDVFVAIRAETRAIGSYLEYLAGEPRQANNKER